MRRGILAGVTAGAVGTATLNITTYLDMVVRGRQASSMPAKTAGRLAEKLGVPLAEDGPDSEKAQSRRSGLGAVLGYVTGLGLGGLYGLVSRDSELPQPAAAAALTVAAMVGSGGPMTALGLTDPRKWSASSWVSDVVPHLAYGVVTATTYDAIVHSSR